MSSDQPASIGDGLNRQARIGQPELAYPPGIAAVPVKELPNVRWIVTPQGIPDTSISGPVMLQQPSRWTHDFDPESGESRASIPAVTPIFETAPPQAPTAPPGSSNSQLATTEFVMRESEATIIRAVVEGRKGVTNGFNAAPGEIGELIDATVPQPGTELQTGQITPLLNLLVPAGDWDLQAVVSFNITNVPTPPSYSIVAAISETPGFPGFINRGGSASAIVPPLPGTVQDSSLTMFQRLLSSSEQTTFLLVYASFPTNRVFASGYMSARRRR